MKITATRDGEGYIELEVNGPVGTHYYRTNRQGMGLWIKHGTREEWIQIAGTDQFRSHGSLREAEHILARRLDNSGL